MRRHHEVVIGAAEVVFILAGAASAIRSVITRITKRMKGGH